MSSTTVTVRLDDEEDAELVERLEGEDVKSDAVREALRWHYSLNSVHDLPEALAKVYDALLTISDGGGRVRLSVAKKAIPQFVTHYDQTTVVDAAFRPLGAAGYLEPIQRIEEVWLYVRPENAIKVPDDVDVQKPDTEDDVEEEDETMTDDERVEALLEGDYDVEGSA